MMLSRRKLMVWLALTAVSVAVHAQTLTNQLAKNTILIVRHAEKPAEGSGLTTMGEARARAYATYFHPFQDAGFHLTVSSLFAGADSAKSMRPRLTLEPLSHASGLPIQATISSKDPEALVHVLQEKAHGNNPLIAWRHGEIPALLQAFGVVPSSVLPNGKWPDDVFDWVIVLQCDAQGKVIAAKRIQETLQIQ